MPLSVTVEASESFPNDESVTLAKLRKAAKPSVAITGAVGGQDIEAGSVTNTSLSATAAIELSKLKNQTLVDSVPPILVVSSTGAITSLQPEGDARVEVSSNTLASVTPSDSTITSKKLKNARQHATDVENLISGLYEDTTYVAAPDDWVMVHDTDADENLRLIKAKVGSVNKVGTTEYAVSTISEVTTTGDNRSLTIDMDGSPFQTVDLSNGLYYKFFISNPPTAGTTVKTVSVRIKGNTNLIQYGVEGESQQWVTGWKWPELGGTDGPPSIAVNMTALLNVTAFGPNDADVIAAYAVTQA
jgi:hypothetical protein